MNSNNIKISRFTLRWRQIVWWTLRAILYVWFRMTYRFQAWGGDNIPNSGPVLLLSNHQSFFDPIIVGLGINRRRFYAMARSGLFNNWFFSALIRTLNAIPVERGESDIAAMRKCLEALDLNHALLIFPEGTRTDNGTTKHFATGTMLLIKRSKADVVPVAIEGAYHVWSKTRKYPKLTGRIGVMYGRPLAAKDLIALEPAEALQKIQDQVEQMRQELNKMLVLPNQSASDSEINR